MLQVSKWQRQGFTSIVWFGVVGKDLIKGLPIKSSGLISAQAPRQGLTHHDCAALECSAVLCLTHGSCECFLICIRAVDSKLPPVVQESCQAGCNGRVLIRSLALPAAASPCSRFNWHSSLPWGSVHAVLCTHGNSVRQLAACI